MRPLRTIIAVCFVGALTPIVLGSAGPLVEVTRKTRPQFIQITPSPRKDGITKFDIVLQKDGEFAPHGAEIELRDKGRLKLFAALVIYREPGKEEWRVVALADEDTVRQGKIWISYGLPPGAPSASRNWSIPLAEFAEEEKPATRPATRPAA